ncbi:urease accessory protein UreD [Halorarius halobius]|uniref:urease accessory protein UreD n=1 Tax=Halorarius halobius TaxID=2962671 RepID=UPI0020CB9819|nr:urease accessory protein UreD [Halorarius halobius]
MAVEGPGTDAHDVPHPAFEVYATESVPQAAVGSPGKDGVLELTFAAGGDGTTLVRDYATAPFHVSGTLDHDPHPDGSTVFVQSPAGSVAQGDRHDIDITVGSDAVAHVSTQSATKVHSMTHNYAGVDGRLTVEKGGHLDYVPEPTIVHPKARYCQDLTVEMCADATAILADVVVPGRLARGERFAFERYFSRVQVQGPDGLLFADTAHIAPEKSAPTAPGVVGEFSVYGTLFIVAPDTDTDPGTLSDRLHEVVADREARAGATELPNAAGVMIRALGERSEVVTDALHAAWDCARRDLVGAPAPERRKY